MDYTSLITSQHADKPNFAALVTALTQPLGEIATLAQSMPTLYEVETVRGEQQDYVGRWVGINRHVPTPIENAWFSWNVEGLGWNQANWKGPYESVEGITDLDDATYGTVMQNQIAANYWDGSVEQNQNLGIIAVDGVNIWAAVADNMDMSVDVYIAGNPSAAIKALIERHFIPPKTAGVRVNDIHYIELPLFALSVQESIYQAGLDKGVFT